MGGLQNQVRTSQPSHSLTLPAPIHPEKSREHCARQTSSSRKLSLRSISRQTNFNVLFYNIELFSSLHPFPSSRSQGKKKYTYHHQDQSNHHPLHAVDHNADMDLKKRPWLLVCLSVVVLCGDVAIAQRSRLTIEVVDVQKNV